MTFLYRFQLVMQLRIFMLQGAAPLPDSVQWTAFFIIRIFLPLLNGGFHAGDGFKQRLGRLLHLLPGREFMGGIRCALHGLQNRLKHSA